MDIVTNCPLRALSFLWQPRSGMWVRTVVVKATYLLQPSRSILAEDQEDPNEQDEYWDDDPQRSLVAPSDLAPSKPRADVLLVGSAYAPGGQPVRSLVVHVAVANVEKAIEVFADRSFGALGDLRDGPRFTKMSLAWERASAGENGENPVGVRPGVANALGAIPLPNLQPPGLHVVSARDFIAPVGLGPIPPSWPSRALRAGLQGRALTRAELATRLFPADLDLTYFQTAPLDQQTEPLRADERIALDHLHPEHPRLVTYLPGIRPVVFIERARGPANEVSLRADTLLIHTDRGQATMVWRGQAQVAGPEEAGKIVVGTAWGGNKPAFADLARNAPAPPLPAASNAPLEAEPAATIPPDEVIEDVGIGTLLLFDPHPATQTLPFEPDPMGAPAPREGFPVQDGALPFAPSLAAQSAVDSLPSPAPPPAPIGPRPSASPWAGAASSGGGSAPVAPMLPTANAPVIDLERAVLRGAQGASDAAAAVLGAQRLPDAEPAAPAPKAAPARPKPEVLRLLWSDPSSAERLRKEPRYRITLAELELRLIESGQDEAPAETRDKREVFEVLSRGPLADGLGIAEAVRDGVDEAGQYQPPLLVVSGSLEVPFDERERLRALVAAIKPLAKGDPKLADLVSYVEELLPTPWLEGSRANAARMGQQLRDAFAQGKRVLAPEELGASVERTLLEKRAYQKRTLWGKEWLRGVLQPAAGGTAVPAYLPGALANELPLFARFEARLLVEVEAREDQDESAEHALRTLALARGLSK